MTGEAKFKIIACIAAVMIPLLLVLDAFQAKKYARLKKELDALEVKQQELVEDNKKLISDISVLSSSSRIENIAENELGMHKAKSEDIVRVTLE